LVVVGAHLRAELADRPLAYRLANSICETIGEEPGSGDGLSALPCSDIWYLNNEELHRRPTISVGGPGVNALSAYLYERLPTALTIEDQLVVQLDVAFDDTRVALWGIDSERTTAAVTLFEERYLAAFVEAAMQREEE
jgi:hypothetical protein